MAIAATAPDAPLVVVCGLDHVNLTEEQDVLAKAGVRLQTVIARTEAEYLERCGEADGLLIQYGAVTRRVLEGLPRVRVLVRYGVGVDGIDVQGGLSTHHDVEANTNRVLIDRARRAVVVADASKIARVAFARICGIERVHELVTDAGADPAAVRAFRDAGLPVTLA